MNRNESACAEFAGAFNDASNADAGNALTLLSETFSDFEQLKAIVANADLNLDDIIALMWIQRNRGCSSGQIADALGVSPSTVTRIRSRLESSDLIKEYFDSSDLRKCNYRITNRGKNVVYEVGKRLGRNRIRRQFDRFIELRKAQVDAGMTKVSDTPQRILLVLLAAEKGLAVGELSELCCISQSKASMALKSLRKDRLVECAPCANDTRCSIVSLAEKGQDIAESMYRNLQFLH